VLLDAIDKSDGSRKSVIDEIKKVKIDNGLIALLAALALHALAVVVELRGLAHPPVVVVVTLALQIGNGIGRDHRLAAARLGGRLSNRFVGHRVPNWGRAADATRLGQRRRRPQSHENSACGSDR